MIEHPVQVEESQLHAPSRCGTTGPTAHLFQCFAKMELNPNKVENLWSWEKKNLEGWDTCTGDLTPRWCQQVLAANRDATKIIILHIMT